MRSPKQWYSSRINSNLIRCYDRAAESDRTEGLAWYQSAHDLCVTFGAKYSLPTSAVCGILAALSPGRQWNANVADTQTFLDEWSHGARGKKLPLVGTYGWRNIVKASKIAAGRDPLAVLGGLKVRAFFACVLDPSDSAEVCIDRHAKSAAIGRAVTDTADPKKRLGRLSLTATVNVGEYRILANHYRRCARNVGILPHQFQATVWVVWRRLAVDLSAEGGAL
jgi:hypothetical protein